MRVLVCVKRVPAPGARIVLTDDLQAVDGRHLPFTVSPHEECAVEEAVRLKEKHGGSVVVLTLGPSEAEEQLRYAVSVGADEAVLLSTDGSDWDPQATAAALAHRTAELEESGGGFDLILFGNESADSAGYQVGIRVAYTLGRPVVSGIKGIDIEGGAVVARRETGAGFEVYRLALPAVVAVKEGINLPRYPTLPSRLRAKKVDVAATQAAQAVGGLQMLRLVTPLEVASTTTILGQGPEAAPAVVDLFEKLGADVSQVIVFVEHESGVPLETSLQALTLAASLGETCSVTVGDCQVGGVARHREIVHPLLSDYAPEAIGEALTQLIRSESPTAMLAAGTERGNEVMSHVAALLDLPLATNVTQVRPIGESWELTRTRWGGSLLEEAALSAQVKLATVAPHVIAAGPAVGVVQAEPFTPQLPESLERTRVVERVTVTEGITLTTAPVVVSGGRGVGSPEGFEILEALAGLLGGAVGCSRVVTNNGWRPHSDQVGQTGTRVAPNLYIACGISGAIQHWVGMMASKNVLAINNDPEAPMVTKADYAVIGDLHPVLEAVVAEVKRRKGLS